MGVQTILEVENQWCRTSRGKTAAPDRPSPGMQIKIVLVKQLFTQRLQNGFDTIIVESNRPYVIITLKTSEIRGLNDKRQVKPQALINL